MTTIRKDKRGEKRGRGRGRRERERERGRKSNQVFRYYAANRQKVYIAKDSYFEQLDNHVYNNSTIPLVVVGESGSGKSSLISNWYRRNFGENPNQFVGGHRAVITHFVGCSGIF